VAERPPREGELRRKELEAMRADVVAHVAALPRSKRRQLSSTFELTLARIDASLASLEDAEPGQPPSDAP
jgi:hypothetical protein